MDISMWVQLVMQMANKGRWTCGCLMIDIWARAFEEVIVEIRATVQFYQVKLGCNLLQDNYKSGIECLTNWK